ncbi:hypothetical protein TVAG_352900 [Trichomonas vaginalis G3]|uniref:Uncharacterized protein n=1 Tax=Trichomonas vaginalis (strain ATCC PRA-98 / G3) TaxID=412133 RepID=A2EG92_TRIV3|nr:hypothetical protein TVAG_352900 [Trichomonas vaginalis G3]|eukprot:XP_001320591.1 hypothetical protein [Trichomonas vaginalis G3]
MGEFVPHSKEQITLKDLEQAKHDALYQQQFFKDECSKLILFIQDVINMNAVDPALILPKLKIIESQINKEMEKKKNEN